MSDADKIRWWVFFGLIAFMAGFAVEYHVASLFLGVYAGMMFAFAGVTGGYRPGQAD